jgi:hypothetical protein
MLIPQNDWLRADRAQLIEENAILTARVKELEANRWANATDGELEDILQGCIGPETLSQVEAEVARREAQP